MVRLDAAQKITVSNKSLFALPIIALVGVACTLAGYLLVKTFGFSIFPPLHTIRTKAPNSKTRAIQKWIFFFVVGWGSISSFHVLACPLVLHTP